ncbi:MAG: methionine ABC transporter permease [Agathobacter sp.]|nr:methionine ABC transporter permease [Agathobacter sp.]MDY3796956.1 methionine ABC transporter permease [Agathobacter sp.]
MQEFLNKIIPNVMARTDIFWESFRDTFVMVGWAGAISFVIGILLGVVLIITKEGGIHENRIVYQVIDKLINFFRSIPFIILLVGLVPLSRTIMGTGIGVKGAIVPLVFGCAPFFSRQMESAMAGVNPGLIEAAQVMGLNDFEIVWSVYLKESIAGIARGTTITIISLIGLTAMAGAVGAGGLGNFAIMYGHDRNMPDVTYTTVIVLVVIVTVIQILGNYVAKRNTH